MTVEERTPPNAEGIGRVHHAGFTVRDLDRSVSFYRDLLGCVVVLEQEKRGGYLAAITGYPDVWVKMVQLRVPTGDFVVELFEYRVPTAAGATLEPARIGNAHICFIVDDLERTYGRLLRAGVEFVSAPVDVDSGANVGGRGLYLRDPDRITIELFQPAPSHQPVPSASPQ